MGIGSSGVVNCANTYLGTANYTVADGYVADRTVIVDGNGPAQLNLNFARDEVLDPRITFSRTSNATRVNAQGLIEYAPHNLLTYSEQFDNASWVKTSAAVTANAIAAPDGTLTADTVTDSSDGAATAHAIVSTGISFGVGTVYTISIYAKQGTLPGVALLFPSSAFTSSLNARFNLSTGVIANLDAGLTGSITNLGNGWYRCSATATATATASGLIQVRTATSTASFYQGDGTGTIYIWGAQLNIGSLQPYYTTSVKNLLGYSQNFENAAWTKSNSSVLTNLLTYSQEFDNASWTKGNVTIAANTVVAPDGTTTGDILAGDGVSATHYISESLTFSAVSYTYSAYLKKGTNNFAQFRFGSAVGGYYANFDLNSGVIGTTNATSSVVSMGNGWYRCSITATLAAATANIAIILTTSASAVGSEANTLSTNIAIWGAQLVQGTNPEEYTVTTSAPAPIQVMGPLGFLGAEKLVENTVNGSHSVTQTTTVISGTKYTSSVYAKAGEITEFILGVSADILGPSTYSYARFNLSTGIASVFLGAPSYSITNIGGGWYRCSVTYIANVSGTGSGFQLQLLNATGQNVYTGDGTSGIYIFGAQLSDSASLDPYSYNFGAAPTSSAYYGPRFDYDPVTLAPKGLLIEESRTNLLTYSEQFDNAVWTQSGVTVSANTGTSPNGTANADKVIPTATSTAYKELQQNFSVTSGTTYTISCFVKADGYNIVQLLGTGATFGNFAINYDLSTGEETYYSAGTSTVVGRSIQAIGNGWYRVSASVTGISTTSGRLGLNIMPASNSVRGTTWAGDGTSGVLFWGMQIEAGSFPTSYIPTTSAQVTRTADNASITGTNFSSWYNQSEGTVAAEYDIFSNTINCGAMAISDGTLVNRIIIRASTPSAQNISLGVASSTTYWSLGFINQLVNTSTKSALAFKQDSIAYTRNNEVPVTDNSALIPVVNQLRLGADGDGSLYLNGHIQSFKFFSKRLLNSYLQSLTQ